MPFSVLVADDSSDFRRLLRIELELAGHIVAGEACDGFEAVARALALQPDIVIMDVDMPGMDGVAATRAIKNAAPTTVVLGFTSHPEGDILAAMRAAGAEATFDKMLLTEMIDSLDATSVLPS